MAFKWYKLNLESSSATLDGSATYVTGGLDLYLCTQPHN